MSEPLAPEDHEKPIQPDTDMTLGHGSYVGEVLEQNDVWNAALTPEGDAHPDAGTVRVDGGDA